MAPAHGSASVAGLTPLREVMARLRRQRPVFHSEADPQHSFARVLWEVAPEVESRLEVPQRLSKRAEYLDLLCIGTAARTAVEFKYSGPGRRPTRDEEFRIHEGRELVGTLRWAEGTYEPNTCTLAGAYSLTWEPYSGQDGPGGEFRWLAVFVSPLASGAGC